MISRFAVALACAALTGCNSGSRTNLEAGTPLTLSSSQLSAVRDGVRKAMKDPDSAKFGTRFAASRDSKGIVMVCGMVNGRNSFGGYTGEKPFYGMLASTNVFVTGGIGGTDQEALSIISVCRQSGVEI